MDADNIIEFIMDPLRLTLIVAGIVVFLAILILGRRSNKQRDMLYRGSSRKDYSFGDIPGETLMDAEVIVLPRRKTESELLAESHFSANGDDQLATEVEPFSTASEKNTVSPDNVHHSSTQAVQSSVKPVESDTKQDAVEVTQHNAARQSTEATVTRSSRTQNAQTQNQGTQTTQSAEVQSQSTQPKKSKQQFVVLYIVAPKGHAFNGKSIFSSTQTLGMALGKHNVFHYPADSAYVGDSAFCMTNMSAEGNFDIENLDDIQTNGVSLILTLPTIYSDGLTVFSNMLAVAQALSKKLGGEIIDQTGMPLTAELVTSMRLDIEKFERQSQTQSLVPEI